MTSPSYPNFDYEKLDRLNRIVTAMKLKPVSISPGYESAIEPVWEYRQKSPIHSVKDDMPHAQLTLIDDLDSDNVVGVLKQLEIEPWQLEDLDDKGKPTYCRVRTKIDELDKLTDQGADYLLALIAMTDEQKGAKSLAVAIAETFGTRSSQVNNFGLDVS